MDAALGFGIVCGVVGATLKFLYDSYKNSKRDTRGRQHREDKANAISSRLKYSDGPTRGARKYIDPVVHYESMRGLKKR